MPTPWSTRRPNGKNVIIDRRFAEGRLDRYGHLVAELVQLGPDVLVTSADEATLAAKQAVTTIPIVMMNVSDPIGQGIIASLARPGGNITGINFLNNELVAKRLELLRELVPSASRVAVLVNPANATTAETTLREAQAVARAMGLQVQVLNASSSREINTAFATLGRERPDALFVGGDGFFNSRFVQLVNLASRHAVPATYADRLMAEAGGLMSYGSDIADAWRQVGVYAGRILKGAKPAELPVVQASKFELVINAETARMLGIAVPASLLAIADQVIE
jgi:putative ABC transport system substrate-binding protein